MRHARQRGGGFQPLGWKTPSDAPPGRRDGSVFELFIPGLYEGEIYKYEIKTRAGEPMLKADPYANYAELRPNNASIVWDIDKYTWNDKSWMDQRAKTDTKDKPMNIYEVIWLLDP